MINNIWKILWFVMVASWLIQLIAYKITDHKLDECRLSIQKQNSAIDDLQKRSEAAIKAEEQKAENARKQAESYNKVAASMMHENVPNDCQAAMQWMVQQSKGI